MEATVQVTNVAIHEASHACIGERLGCAVQSITTVPTRDYAGLVHFNKQKLPTDASKLARLRTRLRASGLLSLAGPVGESHYTHEPVSSILQRCDGDRCEARAAASGYALTLPTWSADTRRQVFDDWLDETADLVRINWRVITALAQRLALNGTLQAADVCRAIAMADRKAA
jgi:hypothetical protein